MKKFLSLLLAVFMLGMSLAGCEASNKCEELNNTEKPQETALDTTESDLVSFENYVSIISLYRQIVELCPRYEEQAEDISNNEENRILYDKIYYATWCLYPRDRNGLNGNCYDQFGYTIKDLNSDGIDELILRLNNHEIIAIFTMVDKEPVLLDYYWNRKNCWIDPDGYLHVGGSSGFDRSVSQIYSISDKTGELILLEEGGTDGHDETIGNTLYYKLVNNEKVYITKEEHDSWWQGLTYDKFEVTETISEYLTFVPLFDQNNPAPVPFVPNRQEKG